MRTIESRRKYFGKLWVMSSGKFTCLETPLVRKTECLRSSFQISSCNDRTRSGARLPGNNATCHPPASPLSVDSLHASLRATRSSFPLPAPVLLRRVSESSWLPADSDSCAAGLESVYPSRPKGVALLLPQSSRRLPGFGAQIYPRASRMQGLRKQFLLRVQSSPRFPSS